MTTIVPRPSTLSTIKFIGRQIFNGELPADLIAPRRRGFEYLNPNLRANSGSTHPLATNSEEALRYLDNPTQKIGEKTLVFPSSFVDSSEDLKIALSEQIQLYWQNHPFSATAKELNIPENDSAFALNALGWLFPLHRNVNILSLGCGVGGTEAMILEQTQRKPGVKVIGVDSSEPSIEQAKVNNQRFGDRAKFVEGDATNVDLQSVVLKGHPQIVMAMGVLESMHSKEQRTAFLKNIRQLIGPTGYVVFRNGIIQGDNSMILVTSQMPGENANGNNTDYYPVFIHSNESLYNEFADAGLIPVRSSKLHYRNLIAPGFDTNYTVLRAA
jgi:SAM-dependent methyltransferase